MCHSILLIGGLEKESGVALFDSLSEEGYKVFRCFSGADAIDLLKREDVSIVVSDLTLPDMKETELMKGIKSLNPHLEVVFLSEKFTPAKLVNIIKAGAYELLKWPAEPVILRQTIRNALEKKAWSLRSEELEKSRSDRLPFHEIIGRSKEIRGVLDMVRAVSARKGSVLICGESGTGKELVARAIHESSPRSKGPFIKINCAALSDGVMESELFGHEKGAFTSAIAKRVGRFELANEGTLFIDEVADMPMTTQIKLLRVLQEREFERVGGNETIRVDVRIVAATNRDLAKEIKGKQFRKDLYYRLNVIQINMPPLQKRKDDIPLLVSHFIEKFNEEEGHNIRGVTKEAMQVLMNYDWPGNIRELENALSSAMTLAKDRFVEAKYLPSSVLFGSSTDEGFYFPFGTSLREMEEEVIKATLERMKGNRTRAAKSLGISLRTIQRKLADFQDKFDK
ncbi:MAG: sigma-54 dependent transcriptional regulator [bacterium]|nr:sigma-54 dependent transcriptional regulator [bacterium]